MRDKVQKGKSKKNSKQVFVASLIQAFTRVENEMLKH